MKFCIVCGAIGWRGHHYSCPYAKQETMDALDEIESSQTTKPEYPRNVTAFINKWQPSETARRKAFWKEFRKAANAYSGFKDVHAHLPAINKTTQNTKILQISNLPTIHSDKGLDTANCSAFDLWWHSAGLKMDPPIMEKAFKEIAENGWNAAIKGLSSTNADVLAPAGDKTQSKH